MKPDAVEILRGVRQALLDVIVPDLQTPAVRAQAGYAAGLLELIAQDWDDAAERLAVEVQDIRSVFRRLAPLIAGVDGGFAELALQFEHALGDPSHDLRLTALQAESDRLRDLVARLVQAGGVSEGGTIPAGVRGELEALLRRCAERRRGFVG